jgi:hypothetical protein
MRKRQPKPFSAEEHKMVRRLTADEVEFTVTAEPEDVSPRGNALASGDDDLDKQCEDEILERLDNGDVWAWAYVVVTAKWNGFEGTAGLGGCCYRDERDFRKNSMYFEDMKAEALDDLNRTIASHIEKLRPLMA